MTSFFTNATLERMVVNGPMSGLDLGERKATFHIDNGGGKLAAGELRKAMKRHDDVTAAMRMLVAQSMPQPVVTVAPEPAPTLLEQVPAAGSW